MKGANVSAKQRSALAVQFDERCGYCKAPEEFIGMPLHVEHIIPRIAGGSSSEDNLCLACPSCNLHKGARTHSQRIPQRMRFTSEVSGQGYELDIVGFYNEEPADAHAWFVECKYRVEEDTIDEVKNLIKKADEYSKTYPRKIGALWFVTRERLPEPVQNFAKENGVYFSNEADVEELLNELWGIRKEKAPTT